MNNPNHLMIVTNTLCNYRCAFCNNPKIEEKGYVTVDRMIELVDLIDAVKVIDITGYGEIMLHPRFKEIAALLSQKGKNFTISTNGSLLTDDMIAFLDGSTLSLLNVSVNSLNQETYRRVTGADLGPVLDNLAALFSQPRHYKITLSAVMTAYSIDELDDLVQYAHDNGAEKLRLLPLTGSIKDYPADIILADTEENAEKIRRAEELARELGVALQSFSFAPTPAVMVKKQKCFAPFNQIIINHNGNVTPCCWLGHVSMGNLKDKSWREIWESEKYEDLRLSVNSGDLKYCRDCREFG